MFLLLLAGHREEVEVESSLDQSKALEVLGLYVNKTVRELPEQAGSIVKECKCELTSKCAGICILAVR